MHFNWTSLYGTQVLGAQLAVTRTAGAASVYPINVHAANPLSYAGAAWGSVLASGSPGAGGTLNDSGLTSNLANWVVQRNNTWNLGVTGCECAGQYTYQKYSFTLNVTYNRYPTVATGVVRPSPATGKSYHTLNYTLAATSSDPDGDPCSTTSAWQPAPTPKRIRCSTPAGSPARRPTSTRSVCPAALWNTMLYSHVYVFDGHAQVNPNYVYWFKPLDTAAKPVP